MKYLGIIGGMSWQSTAVYYRLLNEGIQQRLGGQHSASLLLASVDFEYIAELQHQDRWDELADYLTQQAQTLERSGCDAVLIATNTMHKVAPEIQAGLSIPILDLIEWVGEKLSDNQSQSVLLLGTRFTMASDFYRQRLEKQGLRIVVPSGDEQEIVHSVIFEELVQGQFTERSKQAYLRIINRCIEQEAIDSVILGCTEIPLLIPPQEVPVFAVDTTALHAEKALDWMLS